MTEEDDRAAAFYEDEANRRLVRRHIYGWQVDRAKQRERWMQHGFSPEQLGALKRHGYNPLAVPCGTRYDKPEDVYVNSGGIMLRGRVCRLDGINIDGHEASDLWPADGCIHCGRDWADIYKEQGS